MGLAPAPAARGSRPCALGLCVGLSAGVMLWELCCGGDPVPARTRAWPSPPSSSVPGRGADWPPARARKRGAPCVHVRLRRRRQRAIAPVRPARARSGPRQHRCHPWRSKALTCSSSVPQTSRSPWAIPATRKPRRLPSQSPRRWPASSPPGARPGMPATPENLAEVFGSGCRYVYTHLPRLLSVGAAVFCGAALRLWPKRSRRYAERS